MSIQAGQTLPSGTLSEYIESATEACAIGPNTFAVEALAAGKNLVIFGLPGAYTPTCSAQHVPGYVQHAEAFKARGVDEIWCVSVNDAFVMGAWGRDQHATGIVRMMADGNADWTRALGLDADFSAFGMGVRSQRYAMWVKDGVVQCIHIEAPGKFVVSSAEFMLEQIPA